MSIQISFIIPVYNLQDYLSQCINSLINQKKIKKEIIIVDDGSTDDSLGIAENFSKQYSYITVYKQSNLGVSSARNKGIKCAKGEYICFIDGDDFYHQDFASKFYDICKSNNLDIIRGVYSIYDDYSKEYISYSNQSKEYYNKLLTGEEFLIESIREKTNEVVPWLGFFKKDFILNHNIFFPAGISYEEDQLFFLEALLQKECLIYQSDINFYSYRKRLGSATKTPTLKQAKDILYVVSQERQLINVLGRNKEVKKAAQKYICSSFYQLTSIYGRLSYKDRKTILKMVSLKTKLLCLVYPYDFHQFVKILLFSVCPLIIDFIYYIKLQGTEKYE